jgi:uncharacterized protein with ParB-like and HNH nuclease domain
MEKLKDIVYFENLPNNEIRWMIRPTSVADFFKKTDSILRIPPYQRPYSWEKMQMDAMFEDLLKNISKESMPWFLGPIFTTQKEGFKRYIEILDGQQRITSLSIVLREAYSFYKSFDPPIEIPENSNDELEKLKRLIYTCLITQIDSNEYSAFETDESIKDDFSDYILSILKINSAATYKAKCFINKQGNSEYEQTFKNIRSNIKVTRDFFLKLTEVDLGNPFFVEEGFRKFMSFMDYLLNGCWFIEIPLKDEDYILEIFESINNRGKRLTLSDIIRFKTIHYCDKNNREVLKRRWSNVYKILDKIESKKYILSSDHFFEVFINSISSAKEKKAYTKDDERVVMVEGLLTNNARSKDENIDSFLTEIERVLHFFQDYIIDDDFISTYAKIIPKPTAREKNKAEQLMKLVRLCIKTSKNSLLLTFYIARKSDVRKPENSNDFLQPMFNLVKYTVLKDINLDESSNTMRTLFVDLIYSIEKRELDKMNFYFKQSDRISTKGVSINLLLNENPNYNKLVLLFTQFLSNYEELRSIDSNALISANNLEHFYPLSWSANWKKIEKIHIQDSINKIENVHLKVSINAELDSLCLIGDGKEKGSVLQFLGNKVLIHGSDNKSLGNSSFEKKVEKLTKPNVYLIPVLEGSDFLKSTEFNVEDIMTRNALITKLLEENSDMDFASL